MSSSSEDDCYGDAAGLLKDLKSGWKPDEYTSDPNVTSDDSDESPGRSTKVKRKHKKSTRNTDRALDLDTSATSDASVHVTRSLARQPHDAQPTLDVDASAGAESPATIPGVTRGAVGRIRGSTARGRPPRGKPTRGKTSRGRRSRVRSQNACGLPTINIGCSDSEESNQPLFSKSSTLSKEIDNLVDLDSSGIDNSLNESENEEYSIKVHWRSKEFHKFNIRKYQKISSIFDFFAELEGVPVENLLLTLGDRVLRPVDTPAFIEYNVSHFIEGGVVPHSVTHIAEQSAKKYDSQQSDALASAMSKKLTIKMRSKEMKNPFEVLIGKNQKMSIAMVKFSEELEVPLNRLKFFFDGDPIDAEATPTSLELEGGECLDVHVLG